MSKRYGNILNNQPTKKPRLESSTNSRQIPKTTSGSNTAEDDLWGEDFAEDQLKELDFIASQACSLEANVSTNNINEPGPSRINRPDKYSESKYGGTSSSTSSLNAPSRTVNKNPTHSPLQSLSRYQRFNAGIQQASQKIASSENLGRIADDLPTIEEFKNNLVSRSNLNSTFQLTQKNGVSADVDEEKIKKLEALMNDYKRLLNEKDGEALYLRKQLQQIQSKKENDRLSKTKYMEEQLSQYRREVSALHKQIESLRTQVELKDHELNSNKERLKLQESKSIKFTTPQSVHILDSPRNRTSISTTRAGSLSKVKVYDRCIQTDSNDKNRYYLKTSVVRYPFKKIPQTIFQSSLTEKSIIDIEVNEKTEKRILPIFGDEETLKKLENKDFIVPKVTKVDERILTVEFFQPDIGGLAKVKETGIQSKEVMATVNKIVASARELMLNLVFILQTISAAINNDDIRDMNDVYLSNFYDTQLSHTLSLCDATKWHEKESGIEVRRAIGILSYIAQDSTYLCEYIAGKSKLNIHSDDDYNRYARQMTQYNLWPKKRHDHEFLEIILELLTAISYVRRGHQFTGVICSITRLFGIVQSKIKFPKKGLIYVCKIFREMVFSRPLYRCIISMTEMMIVFNQSPVFFNRLTACPSKRAIDRWNNLVSFTDDACVLMVFIEQSKRFNFDEITMINTTHALTIFADVGFRSEIIPWRSENDMDDCCSMLLTFVAKMLYQCTTIDLRTVKVKLLNCQKNNRQNLNNNFWLRIEQKHTETLKIGIKFFSYLVKRDPEFINRSVVDNSLNLFMEYISTMDELTPHEVERDALVPIKSFAINRQLSFNSKNSENDKFAKTKIALMKRRSRPASTSSELFNLRPNNVEDQEITAMFGAMLRL